MYILLVATLFFGDEIKGAHRWLNIFGFSLQPSEFFKPILTIITGWLIAEQYSDRKFPGILLSLVSISLILPFLFFQPDIGMAVILLGTWIAQLFVSGLSVLMISMFISLAISSITSIYFALPHFADRIDKFLMKGGDESLDLYQTQKSLEAFKSGGLFGKGPGEGIVKTLVPDSHSDFVFSVIGEEYGFIVCMLLISLFMAFVIRSIMQIIRTSSIFCFSTVFGILFQISMQVLVNIGTSLNLIPTKGMTLPFISYGGSSLLSTSIGVGIILALTKKTSVGKVI
jgi:cell division protein FtsW